MTDKFDPYHKWLGIPAADQPPTHYRLLGIEPLESDPDVICNAADARMALVKTFQAGRHSGDSQRLLNELAAAKICLLSPEKKAEYDRRLGERGERRGEREETQDVPVVVAESRPSTYLSRGGKKKSPTWLIPSILVACIALFVLLFVLLGPQNQPVVKPDKQKEKTVAAVKPPAKEEPVPPVDTDPQPKAPEPIEEPKEIAEPEPPPKVPPAEPEPFEPVEQPPETKPTKPPKRVKHSVPDAAAQRKVEQEIRKLFADDFAAADTKKKKTALAAKLRKQAGKMKNDPAARFVCLRLAAETAARTGNLTGGFATFDRLTRQYEANPTALKNDLVEKVIADYRPGASDDVSTADLWLATYAMQDLAAEAERSDDYAQAARAARLAVSLAKMTQDDHLLREMTTLQREIGHRKVRFRAVEEALQVLAEKPDDAAANQALGEWRCFALGDWERGLPLLAKGADAELSDLARRDLSRPTSAEEQKSLGDAWFAAGTKELSASKRGMLARACFWYEIALPKLDGVEKTKLEKRVAELHKKDIRGHIVRGAIAAGDVALTKRGAEVVGPKYAERMLDGNSVTKESDSTAYSEWPCKWTIKLDRVYRLREIRIRLYDFKPRHYNYVISVSADGEKQVVVKDASQGGWSSWQEIQFPPRPVKTIVLEGLHNNKTGYFSVVELEAYCIPP